MLKTMEAPKLDTAKIQEKYLALHRLYKKSPKFAVIQQAEQKILDGDYAEAAELLNTLPSYEELLARLMEHLKHKAVHKTLQRIMNGKTRNIYDSLKGLFSLGTHICIELEKGNTEYAVLLDEVIDSIKRNLP